MKTVLLSLLILSQTSFAGDIKSVELNSADQLIYAETFEICRPGTIRSALRLGFSFNNFTSNALNWLRFLSADPAVAQSVWNNKGLSSSTTRLQRSVGFWLAMSDCYGYRYGVLNYGNLMKQIVDIGHLSTDASSALVGLVGTQVSAKLAKQAFMTYPVISRFVIASVLSVSFANILKTFKQVNSDVLTPEENNQFNNIKDHVFEEPDKAISQILAVAETTLQIIDGKLLNSQLSEAERSILLEKRKSIQDNVDNIYRIRTGAGS